MILEDLGADAMVYRAFEPWAEKSLVLARVAAANRLIAIAGDCPGRVEHDCAAAAAALVDPKYIRLRHKPSCQRGWGCAMLAR